MQINSGGPYYPKMPLNRRTQENSLAKGNESEQKPAEKPAVQEEQKDDPSLVRFRENADGSWTVLDKGVKDKLVFEFNGGSSLHYNVNIDSQEARDLMRAYLGPNFHYNG